MTPNEGKEAPLTAKKLYRAYLTVQLQDGSKKQLVFSSTKNKKDAERRRDRARWEYEDGRLVFDRFTPVSLYAERWAQQSGLSKDASSKLRRYCVEIIGHVPLSEVRAFHIREIFAALDGLSQSSINKACGVISRMFRAALQDQLITRNPMEGLKRPSGPTASRRSMTEQEEAVFLSTLRRRLADGRHAYDAMWLVSYACGLRPGEVRGLLRSCVHLDGPEPCIDVTQACKATTRTVGPPKTPAGVRQVPVPDWAVPLLRKALQKSLWAFPAEDGGPLSHQTYRRRWDSFYNEMQRAAGAKLYRNKIVACPIPNDLTPYHLRHTYCTNLAIAGVPEVIAKTWMGHEDTTMIQRIYIDADNKKLLRKSIALLNGKNDTTTNTAKKKTSKT